MSGRKLYTVTINVNVFDPVQLRFAALQRAVEEGSTKFDYATLRASEYDPAIVDLGMLLDPGTLPGCDILGSHVERFGPLTEEV